MFIFITTCSKSKVGSGSPYSTTWPNYRPPTKSLLKARERLLDLLTRRGEAHKLRGAIKGPDFGENGRERGVYLPAYLRYARGQFMTSLEHDLKMEGELKSGDVTDLWLRENGLYFLSGLYGIVSAFEPIQNYDVDLTGIADDYWNQNQRVLTDAFLESIKDIPAPRVILDCCGEFKYSSLIDWQEIRDRRFEAFHAVDPLREGAQIRAEAASIAADINVDKLRHIEAETKFDGVNADIKFVRELPRPSSRTPGHLPRVGVIDTGLGEFEKVETEATRQGWTRHFRFERIDTRELLGRARADGITQCIYLIPDQSHSYLSEWCKGKLPEDFFSGKLLRVRRPIDLTLEFRRR